VSHRSFRTRGGANIPCGNGLGCAGKKDHRIGGLIPGFTFQDENAAGRIAAFEIADADVHFMLRLARRSERRPARLARKCGGSAQAVHSGMRFFAEVVTGRDERIKIVPFGRA